jgi:DNA-binding NarL/FixJ family response regulator
MLRIGITDDHMLFRKSLRLLINSFGGMEVVLEAINGADMLQQLASIPVDILIVDLQMDVMDGYEASQHVLTNYPNIKILILTFLNEPENIKRVLEIGAHGYFTKNADPLEIKQAILQLDLNGFYVEPSLTETFHNILKESTKKKTPHEEKVSITEREHEIILLSLKEYSSKEISDLLNISVRTVEKHKYNLIEKTESKNFTGVIIYALSHGIIHLNELKK